MEAVIREVVREASEGRLVALVTPLEVQGSLPPGQDARMLVREDGSLVGTVGGGRMEAETHRVGAQVAADGRPQIIHFTLTAEDAREDGLLCGGEVTFLVEPVLDEEGLAPLRTILNLRQEKQRGIEAIRVTEMEYVRRMVLGIDGRVSGNLGNALLAGELRRRVGELSEVEERRILEIECGEAVVRVLINPILPRPTVFIFGGGHVGMALSQIAPTAGFRVVVVDDRPAFANPRRFPNADHVLVRGFDEPLSALPIDDRSYIVVMTRGHSKDLEVVSRALKTPASYVGMIGSRRKVALTFEALAREGHSPEAIARVHAPIGLRIGADTPGEIAISVVAELIQARRLGGMVDLPQGKQTPWDVILGGCT